MNIYFLTIKNLLTILAYILIITYLSIVSFELEMLQGRMSNYKFDFFSSYSKFPIILH